MEIAGREFFSADGKYIFYDLQTPKGKVFRLTQYDVKKWLVFRSNTLGATHVYAVEIKKSE